MYQRLSIRVEAPGSAAMAARAGSDEAAAARALWVARREPADWRMADRTQTRAATDCRTATATHPNVAVRICKTAAATILTDLPPVRAASGCAPSATLPRSRRPGVTVTSAEEHSAKPALVEKRDKPALQQAPRPASGKPPIVSAATCRAAADKTRPDQPRVRTASGCASVFLPPGATVRAASEQSARSASDVRSRSQRQQAQLRARPNCHGAHRFEAVLARNRRAVPPGPSPAEYLECCARQLVVAA